MKKSNHLLSKIKGDFIMEIAFCRIDDRLIHGQVATVWTKMTGCNRIMCVNDDVAQDEMRKKLLIQVAPPGIKAYVVPVDKAVAAYKDPKYDSFKSVNLGGKCFKDGDTLISQAVAVNAEDVKAIRELLDMGIEVEIRKLWNEPKGDVMEALKAKGLV